MQRQLPKNVRQIGNVSDNPKIYVEDYVDTFLGQMGERDEEIIAAALIGEIIHEEEQDYVYVFGAVQMNLAGAEQGEEITVDEEVWGQVCRDKEEYFEEGELIGWYAARREGAVKISEAILKVQQQYLAKNATLFVTRDIEIQEEIIYAYKLQDLMEISGHYIYYEKNPTMQNYMIMRRRNLGVAPGEAIEDRAAKDFRSIIREREEKQEQKRTNRFMYAASTFLLLVIVIIGVTMMNNYDKMKALQDSLEVLTRDVEVQKEEKPEEPLVQEDTKPEVEKEEESKTEEPKIKEETVLETSGEAVMAENSYVVQKGDTLDKISKKIYGDISYVEEICKLNGLENDNLIFIGEKLLLP